MSSFDDVNLEGGLMVDVNFNGVKRVRRGNGSDCGTGKCDGIGLS